VLIKHVERLRVDKACRGVAFFLSMNTGSSCHQTPSSYSSIYYTWSLETPDELLHKLLYMLRYVLYQKRSTVVVKDSIAPSYIIAIIRFVNKGKVHHDININSVVFMKEIVQCVTSKTTSKCVI